MKRLFSLLMFCLLLLVSAAALAAPYGVYPFRLFHLLYCQPDSELGMGVYCGAALGL